MAKNRTKKCCENCSRSWIELGGDGSGAVSLGCLLCLYFPRNQKNFSIRAELEKRG